jgi:hypothetical protein
MKGVYSKFESLRIIGTLNELHYCAPNITINEPYFQKLSLIVNLKKTFRLSISISKPDMIFSELHKTETKNQKNFDKQTVYSKASVTHAYIFMLHAPDKKYFRMESS